MGYGSYRRHRQQVWTERVLKGFEPAGLIAEVAEIVVHECGEPDVIVDLFDADSLAGEDLAEIDLAAVEAAAAAGCEGDGLVVEWVIGVWQAAAAAG